MLFYILRFLLGFGLLISGIKFMSAGFKGLADGKLKLYICIFSENLLVTILTGIIITAIIQSSSATTLMIITLVNAGLITFRQSAGVIMGANIGTTITAQIIIFNIIKYSPYFFLLSILCYLTGKSCLQNISKAFLGFGLLFTGLHLVENALGLFYSCRFVSSNMRFLTSNPFLGIVIGFFTTAIIQSSSAATVFLIALARQGYVDLKTAIFILMGENMGTCVTALAASLWVNRNSKKVAIFHFIFNFIGAVFITLIFPLFIEFISSISPNNIGKQIANAHTIFNVLSTMVIIPFYDIILQAIDNILPENS